MICKPPPTPPPRSTAPDRVADTAPGVPLQTITGPPGASLFSGVAALFGGVSIVVAVGWPWSWRGPVAVMAGTCPTA